MRPWEIIRDQINTANRLAFIWWGAKDVVHGERSLEFRTSGTVRWKGKVIITINGRDLYDVRFFRMRGITVVEDHTVRDVFVEAIVDVINQRIC